MSLNLAVLLRAAATEYPEKDAIILGESHLKYGVVHHMTRCLAGALRNLGLEQGENIAIMLPNVPHFTVAYFAGCYAGTPVVPLNVLLKADEIAYHLEDAEAVALIVWEGFYENAKPAFDNVPGCRHLIVAKGDPKDLGAPEGVLNMNALIHSADPMPEPATTMPDDTAVIIYTSGTTGKPKGAELSHFNLFYNAEYTGTHLMRFDNNTTALVALPLFHSFGQTCMHNAVLNYGGTMVLLPKFDPGQALGLMQRHKVNFFGGVPTMYFAMLNHPEASNFDLSELKYCVSGGAPMPVEVMKAFDEKYKVNVIEGYGLSETSPVACFNVLDKPKKAGTVGLPLRGVAFRLEDLDGNVITEVNTPGEICIKGHNIMKGYYKNPEATAAAIRDGWFHTGDIGIVDEDGYYSIVDRKKDMLIRGGYNVYPREIEEVLYAHEAIAEAAVIGVPHERHGEEVKAVVALKPDHHATADEIIAFCKAHLAAYKYPRIVEIIDELPKGPTGKILKRALRG